MTRQKRIQGITPLHPDESEGLLLTHLTDRTEFDRWEQDNINEALAWVEKHKPHDILNESFLKLLHKKMFFISLLLVGEMLILFTTMMTGKDILTL